MAYDVTQRKTEGVNISPQKFKTLPFLIFKFSKQFPKAFANFIPSLSGFSINLCFWIYSNKDFVIHNLQTNQF